MKQPNTPRRFGLVQLVMVLALVVVAVALVLPMLESARRSARHRTSNTQLRGIHVGMTTYSQASRKGGNDGYYPGLDASGNIIPDGVLTGHSGDGTVPGARLWMLIERNFFTPDYMLNPNDDRAVELVTGPGLLTPPVTPDNFSYAFQSLAGHTEERAEWKETLNTATVVLSDRAIGTGPADISSVWTARGSGDWRGGLVRNDNSTSFETNPVLIDTQYGSQPVNPIDHLFDDDPATADAFLVHDDATTGYSAK